VVDLRLPIVKRTSGFQSIRAQTLTSLRLANPSVGKTVRRGIDNDLLSVMIIILQKNPLALKALYASVKLFLYACRK